MRGEEVTLSPSVLWTPLYKRPFNDYRGQAYYMCRCICGVQRFVPARALSRGKSKSCGCGPRGRKPTVNAERDEKIRQLRLSGKSVKEIAKKFGIVPTRVTQICNKKRRKPLEKEILIEGFISSNSETAKFSQAKVYPKTRQDRVLISVDNLRCTAYPVLEDHPKYEEGLPIFEILEYWRGRLSEPFSPGDLEIIDQLKENPERIVEFRIGKFEAQTSSFKKKWKRG